MGGAAWETWWLKSNFSCCLCDNYKGERERQRDREGEKEEERRGTCEENDFSILKFKIQAQLDFRTAAFFSSKLKIQKFKDIKQKLSSSRTEPRVHTPDFVRTLS